jgi:glycerophosphoryl diester phosphodiesterase
VVSGPLGRAAKRHLQLRARLMRAAVEAAWSLRRGGVDDELVAAAVHRALAGAADLDRWTETYRERGLLDDAAAASLDRSLTAIERDLSSASSRLVGAVVSLQVPAAEILPGDVVRVTVRLANTGRRTLAGVRSVLDPPEGWTVEPAGAHGSTVPARGTVEHAYDVTVSDDAAGVTVDLTGSMAYRSTGQTVTLPVSATLATSKVGQLGRPLVIAHRGASGYRPEHTLAAYRLAVEMGADFIEPDVVPTRDGVLVARHENEISDTTDVADHPEFADRRTTKTIDGRAVTGWFTEDFTLAELKTLRARERLPELRPESAAYDGQFDIPTLDEVLALVEDLEAETGREIGIAPETKHPTYFDSIGLSLEEPLVAALEARGLDTADDAALLQSFEVDNLRDLDDMTDLPLAQLMTGTGAPYDQVVAGTGVTYADMRTAEGLTEVSAYADWVAPEKNQVMPRNAAGATGEPTALVADAHRAGLRVVTWTLRAENQFMATNFRLGADPDAYGDLVAEGQAFLDAGVDALFSDHPDLAVAARDAWIR